MGTGKEKEKKNKKRPVLGYEVVRIVSLAIFLICLGVIGNKMYGYMADDDKFDEIKDWYEAGFWKKSMVANAVKKKKITAAEYKEITGEAYK